MKTSLVIGGKFLSWMCSSFIQCVLSKEGRHFHSPHCWVWNECFWYGNKQTLRDRRLEMFSFDVVETVVQRKVRVGGKRETGRSRSGSGSVSRSVPYCCCPSSQNCDRPRSRNPRSVTQRKTSLLYGSRSKGNCGNVRLSLPVRLALPSPQITN